MTASSKPFIAVVCASNMNRSMEAHLQLMRENFLVKSYGTNSKVKLPGPTMNAPNVYHFGTPYKEIKDDLIRKDRDLYTRNGVLKLLERNQTVKTAPERFQDAKMHFDLVITFDVPIFEIVVADILHHTSSRSCNPVHVVNITVVDNPEEAISGAQIVVDLVKLISKDDDWQDHMDGILDEFERTFANKNIFPLHETLYM